MMFKKVVVIIFFALLIRLPAYSLEKIGVEDLLAMKYEIIFSDQTDRSILTLILAPSNIKNIPTPINISRMSTPNIPLSQTERKSDLKLLNNPIFRFYIAKIPLRQD